MNIKYINTIFLIMCISLIFNTIPKSMQMNFIGGVVGDKLVFYPLLVGILYTFWCEWKTRNVFVYKKVFLKFLSAYIGVIFISLLLGLATYPYYADILNGPVAQIEKLPKVVAFLSKHGIGVEEANIVQLWMIARMIKGLLFEVFYTFIGSYCIFCWYHRNWEEAFELVCKAVIISTSIIFVYSVFIEVPFLAHNEVARRALELINPYIHQIQVDGKWWPPLLWEGQLRSVFAEPSYFGIYTAFAMPFLWYMYFKGKKIIMLGMISVFTFLLFLTKARTGFMLFLGEITLLFIFVLISRRKDNLKKLCAVLVCSTFAFSCSNLFISQCMDKPQRIAVEQKIDMPKKVEFQKSMSSYIDNNAKSLMDPNKRSNRARYSIMEADFRIGLAHPVLGVGRGLRDGFVPEYLPEVGKYNDEIKMWLSFREKLGILKSGFPPLGEYTVRFGETGILGLTIYLMPIFLLIRCLLKMLMSNNQYPKLEIVAFLIAFLGSIAAGIGDTINITYCYWILLGLGYSMCIEILHVKEK